MGTVEGNGGLVGTGLRHRIIECHVLRERDRFANTVHRGKVEVGSCRLYGNGFGSDGLCEWNTLTLLITKCILKSPLTYMLCTYITCLVSFSIA